MTRNMKKLIAQQLSTIRKRKRKATLKMLQREVKAVLMSIPAFKAITDIIGDPFDMIKDFGFTDEMLYGRSVLSGVEEQWKSRVSR